MTTWDAIKEPLIRVIRAVVSPTKYHALYPCRVAVQNSDGTLDLVPDSAVVSGCQKVPLRLGLPGAAVKMAAGARVLLGFENGDPSLPVALLWGESTIQELSLNGGGIGLAKADHTHTYTEPNTLYAKPGPLSVTSGPSSNTTLLKVP